MATHTESPYMTVNEVSAILRLTPHTIRRMCRDGDIPALKASPRRWLIDPSGAILARHAGHEGEAQR